MKYHLCQAVFGIQVSIRFENSMLNFGRQQRRCERGIALGEWESCDQVGGGSGFRSGCRLISGYNTKSQHGSKGSMGFGCDSVVVL